MTFSLSSFSLHHRDWSGAGRGSARPFLLEDETLSIRSLCTIHKDTEDTVEVEDEAHLS
jgi:hypothetical protein